MDDTKRTAYSITISNVNICNILKGQGEKIQLNDDNESFSVITKFEENSIAFILMKKNIRTINQNYDKGLISIKLTAEGIEELNHFLNCEKNVDQSNSDWIDISFQNININDINTLMNFFSSVTPEIINDNNIQNDDEVMIIDDASNSKKHITRGSMKIRNKTNAAPSLNKPKAKEIKLVNINIRKDKEEQNEYDTDQEKKDIEKAIKQSLKSTNPKVVLDASSPDVSMKKKGEKMEEEDIDPYSHSDKSVILIEYPSQYLTREIFVTMEDYLSVGKTQYLCSNIIDFYLSYIYHEKLTDEQRDKVLIFPSAFFALYSTNSAFSGWKKDENVGKSGVEKRFERIKGMLDYQPNMNILDKDFLIIPICQANHWFLTIVCFPYLKNAVTYDGEMVDEPCVACKHNDNNKHPPIKQPLILTFDSLNSNPQRRTAAMIHIRKFLKSYYLYKNGNEYDLQKIIAHTVICPVQPNNYDCGYFLLEFVVQFLINDPIIDYRLPIDMSKWFKSEYLGRKKRNEIVNLIREKLIDPSIELPELLLLSQEVEDNVDMDINSNDDNHNKCEEDHNDNNKNIINENITSDGNHEDKEKKDIMEGRNNKEEASLTKSRLHLNPKIPEKKILSPNKLFPDKPEPMETEESDISKCDDGKTESTSSDEKLTIVNAGNEDLIHDSIVIDSD